MKRLAGLAVVAVTGNAALAGVLRYNATILPQLDPNANPDVLTMTTPSALNAGRTVVGAAGLSGVPGAPGGFRWSAAQGPTFLQPLFAGIADYVTPNAITNGGAIAGTYIEAGGSFSDIQAFHLSAGGAVTTLPTLPGHQIAGAVDMNEVGDVVGVSFGSGGASGALWTQRDGVFTVTPIPGLGLGSPAATAVNDNRVVVGYDHELFEPYRPFRWTPAGGAEELPALVTEMPATAHDVNNAGVIGGRAALTLFQNKAVYWDDEGVIHDLPSVHPYGPSDFADVQVLALNESSSMVGYELSDLTDGFEARVWIDGSVYELQDLVDGLSNDYKLEQAVDINDAGDILVQASTIVDGNIQFVSVLLTPVPEPGTLALLGAAALLLGRGRPRRGCAAAFARDAYGRDI